MSDTQIEILQRTKKRPHEGRPGQGARRLRGLLCVCRRFFFSEAPNADLARKLKGIYAHVKVHPWDGSRTQRYLVLALDYFLREHDFVPDSAGRDGLADDAAVVELCLSRIGMQV